MYTWLRLETSADLEALLHELGPEYGAEQVVARLQDGLSDSVKAILLERDYIDKDYRSTFYSFYAKKGQGYRKDCVRLHLFDETVTFDAETLKLGPHTKEELSLHYFGYMVLRPTGIATIGRTVVSPSIRNGATGSVITGCYKIHLLGYELQVRGFPSMDQHADISVCAHAACWSILRHYSQRYTLYREHLTYDITLMAHQFDPGGLVPAQGLQMSQAERVFQEAGTYPIHIARANEDDPAFYRQLIAYIESGFPLFAAMHERRHAIAVIGYDFCSLVQEAKGSVGSAWDLTKSLVVVDDNFLPYLMVGDGTGSEYTLADIDSFLVPLPEKIFYPAEAVDELGPTIDLFGAYMGGLPDRSTSILRYFVTTGSAYRKFVREHASEFDPKLMQVIMELPFAQFVWVVEIATAEDWDGGQVSARAILDATASVKESLPFWLIHNRSHALVFNRQTVGDDVSGMRILDLSGMEHTALSRMEQNLRPVHSK
jgi:hypothetical protein